MSTEHDDLSSSNTDEVVTAYHEIENGFNLQESIDRGDIFATADDQITPETTDDNTDGDEDDDTEDDDSGHEHKGFKFEITDNVVTAVYEFDDGIWESKSIDDDGSETYTVDGSEVIRTETKPFGTEITHYADADGDGIYVRVSEEWQISPDSSGIKPQLDDKLLYLPTDDDDFIAVRSNEDCYGGLGADGFVVREAAHLRIDDFNSLEDDTLIFDTGLGLTSKEHLASFITDVHQEGLNLVINFGVDVSITLVGIQPDEISWDDVSVLS